MATLYVVEQGAVLSCDGERLDVRHEGQMVGSIPLAKLDDVVVWGNVGLTTPAIKRLLDRKIEVVFLTMEGRYHGRLLGEATAHVALRQAQYGRAADGAWTLRLAQAFVEGKLRNQRALLQRFTRNRANPPALAAAAAAALDGSIQRVRRTTQLASLLGVEGSATACYFGGVRSLLGPEWGFAARRRRPPTDPVNVLLSLCYTLLAHKALGAVQAAGFDPYLGFLHRLDYGRPSLALDLMEEFRPLLVDSLVLRMCGDGRVSPEDFVRSGDGAGLWLKEEAKRTVLRAFDERMRTEALHPLGADSGPGRVSYLRCLGLQARHLVHVVLGKTDVYRSFTVR